MTCSDPFPRDDELSRLPADDDTPRRVWMTEHHIAGCLTCGTDDPRQFFHDGDGMWKCAVCSERSAHRPASRSRLPLIFTLLAVAVIAAALVVGGAK